MTEARCPGCGWRGDPLEAVPGPDSVVRCPDCGEQVEAAPDVLPDPPPLGHGT